MGKALDPEFFGKQAPKVAVQLLGKYLVCKKNGTKIALKITEVEAYEGFADRASHASRGETARNAPMFGLPGRWYVYFTYGMHWMLNIVTGPKGHPAAVLIRGLEGVPGPGRLTKKLGIDKRFNAVPASRRSGLWIEDRGDGDNSKIKKGPRIGVNYAGPYWSRRKWRFWI